MEGDLDYFEEDMRSPQSFKWHDAIKDEMRSMSTNTICKLEEISKRAKIVRRK
jgi:hypothetical protein